MNKLLGSILLGSLCLLLGFGSAGCQKPTKPAPAKDTPAGPKEGASIPAPKPAPPVFQLESKVVDLTLDEKKSVEKVIKVTTGNADSIEAKKPDPNVTAKLDDAVSGKVIKITATKEAKPGEYEFTVKHKDMNLPLYVHVKGAPATTPAKDEAKKDEAKKDEAKKDGAKKDEAKKDEAKKDEAKKDSVKKDDTKKDDVKKDDVKKDDVKKDDVKKDDAKKDKDAKKDTSYLNERDELDRFRSRPELTADRQSQHRIGALHRRLEQTVS